MVAIYLRELAATLHSYYNAEQFLVPDEALKLARLALIAAVASVIKDGLTLLGVGAPNAMHRESVDESV
jgi:arginyl-tRNA synthetase